MHDRSTRTRIIDETTRLFALQGEEGLSMRTLARECGVSLAAAYHYFATKDDLLGAMYQHINTSLGQARALLPQTATADEMLRQRVAFQIDHAREIVAVLKYYLTYRSAFGYTGHGFVPEKAYEHMREVLARGQGTGEFAINDLDTEAKVMTHAVNGFLLEYHPYSPQGEEKKQLVETITGFLLRALVNRSCDTTSPLS